MAQYTVTRACGHEETVYLFGPGSTRRWRLDNVEPQKLCEECYQIELAKKREQANQEAAEAAKQMKLPELVGSERQVPWAETIRQQILIGLDELVYRLPEERRGDINLLEAIEHIKSKTDASWWIDRRGVSEYQLKQLLEEASKEAETEKADTLAKPLADEAKIEATVRPENPKTETVAEIRALADAIEISFPERREDFRQIVKGLGFSWSTIRWERKIYPKNGMIEDRAAEVGNKLLAAGFPIRIYDETIRQRAINGEYEPECKRWIQIRVSGEHEGWLVLSWEGYNDSLYRAAKKIAGARWSRPSIVVPVENYEEVLDFAQMYGFKISEKAQAAIDAARELKEKALTTGIKVSEIDKTPEPGAKPPVLEIPDEVTIDAELRDED
jgi:hypothetical protein